MRTSIQPGPDASSHGRVLLLVALAMVAFAANSILNRVGVTQFKMNPVDFAAIRIIAGALILGALLLGRGKVRQTLSPHPQRLLGAALLASYMFGFSSAYTALDAGIGALILFGVVQEVVFAWAIKERQRIPAGRWRADLWPGLCVVVLRAAKNSVHHRRHCAAQRSRARGVGRGSAAVGTGHRAPAPGLVPRAWWRRAVAPAAAEFPLARFGPSTPRLERCCQRRPRGAYCDQRLGQRFVETVRGTG